MTDLILDAGIVAAACKKELANSPVSNLLDKACKEGWKTWIYVGQISEILQLLTNSSETNKNPNESKPTELKPRLILRDFAMAHHWLSALSDEAECLEDSDPTGIALMKAASRIGGKAIVVTDNPSRIQLGHPFIDVNKALKQATTSSVNFIDLMSQQDRIRPNLEKKLHQVLHHGKYLMGPEIAELEDRLAEFVGVDHCICLASGTDALLVALMSMSIGAGDEVITSPFTFAAVGEVISLLGAKPVYIDIDPLTYTINPDLIDRAITNRTRAIIPVNLYGQCSDMDSINDIASQHGLPVIEDAAQSFGAMYKNRRSCSLSTIGCTSFFPSKPIGAYGDAGACFTQNSTTAEIIRTIINHGQKKRYEHVSIGITGRMDSLQAAVLLSKLEIFSSELEKREEVSQKYKDLLNHNDMLGKIKLPYVERHNISAWAQFTVEVDNREKIQERLFEQGIPTAIHYPVPLYRQPSLFQEGINCPEVENAAKRVLSLPMHPYLKSVTQELIADHFKKAVSVLA